MTANFKVTNSAKMLAILAVATGAKINFKLEGNELLVQSKDPGTEGHKEWQNATLLSKYVREMFKRRKGTAEAKIKSIVENLRGLGHLTTFRALNNNLRSSTYPEIKQDDGTAFFWEGMKHPSKIASLPAKKEKTPVIAKEKKAIAKPTKKTVPPIKAEKTVKAKAKKTPAEPKVKKMKDVTAPIEIEAVTIEQTPATEPTFEDAINELQDMTA